LTAFIFLVAFFYSQPWNFRDEADRNGDIGERDE
jgi:hypothetical protein